MTDENDVNPFDGSGGPAFPLSLDRQLAHRGMTLRDWFAGQALIGLLAADRESGAQWDGFAKDAYSMADAMIRKRRAEPAKPFSFEPAKE